MAKSYILVVDDDETIRVLVESILQKEGFETVAAENGKDCLNILKSAPPTAIILDWEMPEIDGLEVLKTIKADEKTKSIPVMMLTSKNNIADVSECLEAGANDYSAKPFDHNGFIMRVRKLLAG